eukprot:TRINITY_DN2945_c0_g1_i1.p2 TRINITY_DN2945_c0_g1~~TRINITY_DN2945_c0_g1_i1.p2  ORF type:complete len:104 (-),score=10.80 TRINITY_DN2945_c0_g1_i1:113-424(-)
MNVKFSTIALHTTTLYTTTAHHTHIHTTCPVFVHVRALGPCEQLDLKKSFDVVCVMWGVFVWLLFRLGRSFNKLGNTFKCCRTLTVETVDPMLQMRAELQRMG